MLCSSPTETNWYTYLNIACLQTSRQTHEQKDFIEREVFSNQDSVFA